MLRLWRLPVAKNPMDNKGGYEDFTSKNFCFTRPKNSVGEHFSVSLNSGIGNLYPSEGCHHFLSICFCLTVPKNSLEEPFCAVFQRDSGDEKDYG